VCIVFGKHGSSEVEVFEIAHHALCLGCGDNTVKEKFGSGPISHFGADITIIVDPVATNSPVDMMGHCFLRVVCTDNVQVGGFAPGWQCSDWDEKHGVGAWHGCSALSQAMDFCNIGSLLMGTIRAVTEGTIFCNFAHVGIECIAMASCVLAVIGSM